MTTPVDGFPAELLSVDLQQNSATLVVDSTIYPLEALYGASYVFIDRCFVALDRPQPDRYRAVLSPKRGNADAAALRALVGEFANELLSCAWRQQLMQENRATIEAVTTQALAGAMGPPSLDELASFDFTEENFEDPLGIAMSWEDKYKKKDKPAESAASSGPANGATTSTATSEETDAAAGAAGSSREAKNP